MIITLNTADVATARAALAEALAQYGPPITLRQPGLPDLTVGCTLPELHERMARFWAGMYAAAVRSGEVSASTGGAEHCCRPTRCEAAACLDSTPTAGAETGHAPDCPSSLVPVAARPVAPAAAATAGRAAK